MFRLLFFAFILAQSNRLLVQELKHTVFPMSDNALLWKIEGPNVKKDCYLFGTMHLIEKNYFFFPDKLTKIVSKSEQLVMELSGIPNQLEVLELLQLKEGSFFDFFTPQQTDSILNWATSELKMTENQFKTTMGSMKPFVAIQLAAQMHFLGKTESYEMTLEAIARDNNLEVKGLETIEQQLSFFDNLSKEKQAEMVMEVIRKSDELINSTLKIEKLYNRQNVDSLYLMIHEEGGILSQEENTFLEERNKKWVPKIASLIAQKRTFIAIGAGHLGGPNGLIRLLEQNGYILTPIKLEN
ncbi:MAG: TraB/GumN family protein [Flavobacteriia bacterium]